MGQDIASAYRISRDPASSESVIVALGAEERADEAPGVVRDRRRQEGALPQPPQEAGAVPVGPEGDSAALDLEGIRLHAAAVLPGEGEHGPGPVGAVGHAAVPKVGGAAEQVACLHGDALAVPLR